MSEPADLPRAPEVPADLGAPQAWQRLAKAGLGVTGTYLAGLCVAAGFGLFSRADAPLWLLFTGAVVVITGGVLLDLLRWFRTAYRIVEGRFQLHTGLVFRNRKSIPLERIRSVDATANPIQRVFGVTVVTIGTGEQAGADDKLKLDAVSRDTAEVLRGVLLDRTSGGHRPTVDTTPGHIAAAEGSTGSGPPVSGTEGSVVAETTSGKPRERTLARLHWSWIKYAPLTLSSVLGIGALLGVAYKPLDLLGLNPGDIGLIREAFAEFEAHPLWLSIGVLVLAALVLGVLGSFVLFVESWWRFRLTAEDSAPGSRTTEQDDPGTRPGTTYRVRRGLLTSRSLTLERRRLRGLELTEPLLLRWGGGARTHAVATGMNADDGRTEQASVLLPPTPREVSERISAELLGAETAPSATVRLRPHPRAALRRRLVWSLVPVAALVLTLAVLGYRFSWMPWWAWSAALPLLVVAAAFGRDAYRNLGHGLTDRYLVLRWGTGVRRTVSLQRTGILGWNARQTLFQRRAGLLTVTATTAAGAGAYHVRDVDVEGGLLLAERTVADLLTPFLERVEREPAQRTAQDGDAC